jgi:hypothetical protein
MVTIGWQMLVSDIGPPARINVLSLKEANNAHDVCDRQDRIENSSGNATSVAFSVRPRSRHPVPILPTNMHRTEIAASDPACRSTAGSRAR